MSNDITRFYSIFIFLVIFHIVKCTTELICLTKNDVWIRNHVFNYVKKILIHKIGSI